jgi:hypothetical protein
MLHILRYEDLSCNFCNLDTVLTDRVCCFWRYCLAWFCVRQNPAVCTDWFVGLLNYSVTHEPTAPDTINFPDHVAVVGARFETSDWTHRNLRIASGGPNAPSPSSKTLRWAGRLRRLCSFTAVPVIRMTGMQNSRFTVSCKCSACIALL